MEINFTPEQEAKIAHIASLEGVAPDRLVRDAVLKGLGYAEPAAALPEGVRQKKVCPECGHRFQGNGWDGIDAHWRSQHEDILPYKIAWPFIQAGNYDTAQREDAEDLFIAETRLAELRAGRSQTHTLDEVERELGLAD